MNHNNENLEWIDNNVREELRDWVKNNMEPGVIDLMAHMPDNKNGVSTTSTMDDYNKKKKEAIESFNSRDKESNIKIVL